MKSTWLQKCDACAIAIALFSCSALTGQTSAPADRAPAQPPVERSAAYAPGIRINWARSIVELDGTVVLRRGPLELFACTPRTREHESIVAVHARPQHIFEALGLVGLEPGAPAHYGPDGRRRVAARGAALRIDVAVRTGETERVFGVHEWMRHAGGGRHLERCDWVFAGSRRLPNGGFAADGEGTVICVVDFASAVIALPDTHTSDNAALWVEADSEQIPPLGTACIVRISSARRGRTLVSVRSTGELWVDERPMTLSELERHLRFRLARDPGAHAMLLPQGENAFTHAKRVKEHLANRGLEILLRAAEPTTQSSPEPPEAQP